MPDQTDFPLDQLLFLIARSAPNPWYPAEFSREANVPREPLEHALDKLRLARLIEFTPWESGKGQGLQLTKGGVQVLQSSRSMARLAKGIVPSFADAYDVQAHGRISGPSEAIRAAFLRPAKPRVTQTLIAINVAVFLIGMLIAMRAPNGQLATFDENSLRLTGAISGETLANGQWWRLLACCFVHFGGIHLFMNMYALWVLGPIQERLWGRVRYLTIYLISGFVGSCVAMCLHPEATLAGASGCIWGLLTSQLVWLLMNRNYLNQAIASQWTRQLVTAIILNAMISFIPGISMEAHFAGGIAGAIVAALLHVHRFGRGIARPIALAIVILIPILSIASLVWAMNNTQRWRHVVRIVEVRALMRPAPANDSGEP